MSKTKSDISRTLMLTARSIAKDISRDVQILPYDQSLNGTKLKGLECVLDTEAVPASILTDLIEVLLDKLLLLHELDIGE